jgi:hypothetical protein
MGQSKFIDMGEEMMRLFCRYRKLSYCRPLYVTVNVIVPNCVNSQPVCEHQCGIDTKLKLALLSIACREPLKDGCVKTGTCSTTEGVKNQPGIKPC